LPIKLKRRARKSMRSGRSFATRSMRCSPQAPPILPPTLPHRYVHPPLPPTPLTTLHA
jgi:hypothetical protein